MINDNNLGLKEKLVVLSDLRPLDKKGGGGDDSSMETRLTKLEVEFEHVRKDLDDIKLDLKDLKSIVLQLPTKADLRSNLQWIIGTTFAAVALFVGILAYLQDQRIASAPPPAPTIIQLPVPQILTLPTPVAPAPQPPSQP